MTGGAFLAPKSAVNPPPSTASPAAGSWELGDHTATVVAFLCAQDGHHQLASRSMEASEKQAQRKRKNGTHHQAILWRDTSTPVLVSAVRPSFQCAGQLPFVTARPDDANEDDINQLPGSNSHRNGPISIARRPSSTSCDANSPLLPLVLIAASYLALVIRSRPLVTSFIGDGHSQNASTGTDPTRIPTTRAGRPDSAAGTSMALVAGVRRLANGLEPLGFHRPCPRTAETSKTHAHPKSSFRAACRNP